MSCISSTIEIPAITNTIKFNGITMDMGGGEGKLLLALLNNNSEASGILFDLPEVINSIEQRKDLPILALNARCALVKGNFFDVTTIPKADTIILKRVLHDWSDERAIIILKNCLQKLSKDGKIIIIEYLAESELMAKIDLLMMAIGGRARSAQMFQQLCEKAGFEIKEITSVTPMLSAIHISSISLVEQPYYLKQNGFFDSNQTTSSQTKESSHQQYHVKPTSHLLY